MSRDLRRENAALRARLRDTETRLMLLASAVLAGDRAAEPLARLVAADRLKPDGESQEPPSPQSESQVPDPPTPKGVTAP